MNNKVTYNSLLQDDKFLSNAYHSLKAMGETVTNNRQEVLDKFLQKRRYFDTNISSTFTQGSKIKQLSDVNKKNEEKERKDEEVQRQSPMSRPFLNQ